MCRVYVNTDQNLYESSTRSMSLHGVVTTVRLENLFWNVLEQIARQEKMTVSRLITQFYDELMALHDESPANFTSFLRVCCLRYLSFNVVDQKGLSKDWDKFSICENLQN